MRGIAALFFLLLLRVANASQSLPVVRVGLVDMAGLSPKVRSDAQGMVVALFRKSGVRLEFVDSLPPDYWLQILSSRPQRLPLDTAGFALLVPSEKPEDSYAAVFLPQVEAAARNLDATVTEVLAASMAHEIGHLLLHSSAHARTGIMSPRLDRPQIRQLQRGELLFLRP
ncbi:MAG TPA: hypothetical protein VG456_17875 [Candidatus Sulfopaludibacter sp.]|jgi:hypothetical protein|nr:hypothetical protein [Candidatus Sulfopaludibacter sp.]